MKKLTTPEVFVPYRGIYFLYSFVCVIRFALGARFRPLSGNLLSLQECLKWKKLLIRFSSPIGESTFSTRGDSWTERSGGAAFSSPIGESTFSTAPHPIHDNMQYLWFSSPIGESTFSTHMRCTTNVKRARAFSSPIGESTFSTELCRTAHMAEGIKFSSPIGESTFSTVAFWILCSALSIVFVPYRGIYFLYMKLNNVTVKYAKEFSSPIGESTFSTW